MKIHEKIVVEFLVFTKETRATSCAVVEKEKLDEFKSADEFDAWLFEKIVIDMPTATSVKYIKSNMLMNI